MFGPFRSSMFYVHDYKLRCSPATSSSILKHTILIACEINNLFCEIKLRITQNLTDSKQRRSLSKNVLF